MSCTLVNRLYSVSTTTHWANTHSEDPGAHNRNVGARLKTTPGEKETICFLLNTVETANIVVVFGKRGFFSFQDGHVVLFAHRNRRWAKSPAVFGTVLSSTRVVETVLNNFNRSDGHRVRVENPRAVFIS